MTWEAIGVDKVSIRCESPQGTLLGEGREIGSITTGTWVRDGMQFFLIDESDQTVLASLTVHITSEGCPQPSLEARPNPIQVCNGSVGQTTLFWEAPGHDKTQIRIGSPTGQLLSNGREQGSKQTGNWVRDGMQFFLVDTNTGEVLDVETASFTTDGCPYIYADPNPIQVCEAGMLGKTTIHWSAPEVERVDVRVNSPTGNLLVNGRSEGSKQTGEWVRDGMTFYLLEAGTDRVLNSTQVRLTRQGCPGDPEIVADPNPIQVCDGSGLGTTLISWNAPGYDAVQIRINDANGQLFANGRSMGAKSTAKWVRNGMRFVLTTPLSQFLASVELQVSAAGCPADSPQPR